MYYRCPDCSNPGAHAGALDRFVLVDEKRDGMLVVDCLDCGARSESYHRDLRGKVPRKYSKRTAIMIAADFVLDGEIREYNDFAGVRTSGAMLVSGVRQAPGAPAKTMGIQGREGTGVSARAAVKHSSPTTVPGCPPSMSGGRGGPRARGVGPVMGESQAQQETEGRGSREAPHHATTGDAAGLQPDGRERPATHAGAPATKPDKQPLSTGTATQKSPTKNRRVAAAGAPKHIQTELFD